MSKRNGARAPAHLKHKAAVYQGNRGYKPKQAERVDVRTVACADCGAAIGQPCTTLDGRPNSNTHRSRRRLAVRRLNEQRDTTELPPT